MLRSTESIPEYGPRYIDKSVRHQPLDRRQLQLYTCNSRRFQWKVQNASQAISSQDLGFESGNIYEVEFGYNRATVVCSQADLSSEGSVHNIFWKERQHPIAP